MQRLKVTERTPPSHSGGNWLAGLMIGSAIMTMATQAMLMGASAALKDAAIKRG